MKQIKISFDKKSFELAFSGILFVVLISLGIAVLAPYLLTVRSERATVNGEIIVIRSPIAGTVNLENDELGQFVNSQQKLGSINHSASIQSPIDGSLWSVMAHSHETVQANDPIVSIVDCRKRWVEALFFAVDNNALQPGRPVKVKILGSTKQTLEGRIEASRAGLGRRSPGEDIVDYIREAPKDRVALRISVQWSKENNDQADCDVGRSVEVVVPRFF